MPRPRLLSSSLVLAAIVACGAGAVTANAAAPASRPSTSDAGGKPHLWDKSDHGFTLQTSGDWISRPPVEPSVVMTLRRDVDAAGGAAPGLRLLIITAVPLKNPDNPTPLDAQVEAVHKVIAESHPEAKFDPVQDMTLDRVDAKMLPLKYTLNKKPMAAFRIVAENAGKLYLVAYSCDEASAADGRQEMDSILRTFRWTKK